MTRDAKIVALGICATLIASYVGFTFVLWDPNPSRWDMGQRAGAVFLAVIFAPIWIAAASCIVRGR